MPYDITTKDGITIRNIPDNVPRDAPELKARVAKIRGEAFKPMTGKENPPQQETSLADRFANFGKGAQAAISAPLVGAAQRLGLDGSQARSDAWREDMDSLSSKPGGAGGALLGGAGVVAPLAMIPGANTILGGAAIGALHGSTMPTQESESPLVNAGIGAITGGAVPAAIRTAKVIKASAVDPFTEAGRDRISGGVLNRMAGDDAQAVAARLATAKGNTPGFVPSVAQAADNPGISAFERTMRAIDPNAFNALDKSQKGALVDALISIAKTPEERAAAVALRENAVKPLYDQAKKSVIQGDDQLEKILSRPTVQAGLNEAKGIAADEGRPFVLSKSTPAVTGSLGNVITPATPPTYSGQGLHDLKMGIDKYLTTGTLGIGNRVAESQNTAKEAFLNWLESNVPAYGQAKQTYADMSKPINQMDIGREFYNKFVPALADTGGLPFKTRADSLATALRNGDEVAKAATKFPGATLKNTLTPEQIATLEAVVKDSASKAAAEMGGKGVGSDTVQKIAMSNIASEAGIPTWISNMGSVPGGWAKRAGDVLYGNADKQVRERLAELLTNPQEAAQVMQAVGKNPSMLADLIRKASQATALASPKVKEYLTAE